MAYLFGLSCNDIQFIEARRNKYLMQERIKACGLRSIRQMKSHDFNEVLVWLKNSQIDTFMLKPLKSAGADQVIKCFDLADARKHFDKILNQKDILNNQNHQVLVQEFIEGTEYVVDTVSYNGNTYTTDIGKYTKSNTSEGSIYQEEHFIQPDLEEMKTLVAYNKKVVQALGIKIGAAHSEIMLSEKGPVLIEVGARLNGAGFPNFIGEFCSPSLLELNVDAYINAKSFIRKTSKPASFTKQCQLNFLKANYLEPSRRFPGSR